VNVTNVSFVCEGIDQWHHILTIKKGKRYRGVCVRNAGDDEQMYEQAGQSQNVIGKLLSDVLSQTGYHGAHTNRKGKKAQNLIIGMSNL
jgi:hypothetical protein